jgi:DNA-binding response OmpR family regulator
MSIPRPSSLQSSEALSPGTILLVDDNLRVSEEVALVLEAAGWSVSCADDATSFRQMLSVCSPQIVILDLNLPGEDGISLCKWLRQTEPEVGIVMLTARVMGSERTAGYMAGADVYLTKPTRPEELLAVVNNLTRRSRLGKNLTDTERPWTLQFKSARLVSPQGDMLSLTPGECLFLRALALTPETTTYAELFTLIHGDGFSEKAEKARLEVLVSRLRTKLGKFGNQALEVKTVHNMGYRLEGALRLQQEG